MPEKYFLQKTLFDFKPQIEEKKPIVVIPETDLEEIPEDRRPILETPEERKNWEEI